MIADRGASHDGPDCSGGWTGEEGARLLHSLLPPALFASRLVEPGFHMALPVLVEVSIRNHIISLTHLECLVFWKEVDKKKKRHGKIEN